MKTKEYFATLREHLTSIEMPKNFKNEVIAALQYFEFQAGLSVEEREHPRELKRHWLDLNAKIKGLKLFDKFEKEELLWRTIKCFVHAEEPCSLLNPAPPEKVYRSKYADWTYIDFFDHLAKNADHLEHLNPQESQFFRTALWYLAEQAHRGRGQRNLNRILETWKGVQPLLDRLGMLKEFRSEFSLKKQIDYFLTDKLG